jgi:hypothetical protein
MEQGGRRDYVTNAHMNQAVRALREVDKVLRKLGVARDDYRMS